MKNATYWALTLAIAGSPVLATGVETKAVEEWQANCIRDDGTIALELVQAEGKSKQPYAVFSCTRQDGTIAVYAAPLVRL